MELRPPSTMVYSCVMLLICLLEGVWSKSLRSIAESQDAKRCLCGVQTSEGAVIQAEEQVEPYPHWPDMECHYLHQRCRHLCASRLKLEDLDRSRTHPTKPAPTFGYKFCTNYGRVTPPGGLDIEAHWRTPGCPHEAAHVTKHMTQLCCGHTTIPVREYNSQVLNVFGWNPDCKAMRFVIGK